MKHLLLSTLLLVGLASATAPRAHAQSLPSDTVHVRNGQLAPNIILLDDKGKSVSLSSFRGKIVYLDFWGTWCHPCMRELTEYAPALRKLFEGRDVVFLYVSVGDTEEKWKQVIAERQLAGPNTVHLHAINLNQTRAYGVKGFPSYYLIGRDGRFKQVLTSWPSAMAKTVANIEGALNW